MRVRSSLRTWGFTNDEDVRVVTGRAATKAGLEEAFGWVASRATDSADVVVIYYSGHGSHAPDADGDEPDGRDEGLVPFSDGPASCPGRNLALLLSTAMLAALLRRRAFTPIGAEGIGPGDRLPGTLSAYGLRFRTG